MAVLSWIVYHFDQDIMRSPQKIYFDHNFKQIDLVAEIFTQYYRNTLFPILMFFSS